MLRSKLFDGLKRISTPFRTRTPHRDGARRRRGFRRPRLECLERRELLSVAGWVTTATGPEHVGAVDLATDLEGNVYVTGDFRGTADFAPDFTFSDNRDILTSSGGSDSFAAKYGPDGLFDWVRGLGAIDGVDWGKGIAVEAVGNETDADNVYIVAADGDQWKLNGDDGSTIRWDEDNSSLELRDVAVDPANGDTYLTGSFSGTIGTTDTVSGETITLTSNGNRDVFVAKQNSEGLVYWLQHDGGRRSYSGGDSINLDASGNVYVTGNLDDQKGPGSMHTRGQSDVFVSKLDARDGSFVWTQRAGGDGGNAIRYGGDAGYEITVDNSGGVYVTGALAPSDSPADFGDFQIDLSSHVGSYNFGFVTKLDDATGDFLWATSFGGSGTIGGSLDFDSTGKLYLGGRAETAGSFGAFDLPDRSGPSIGFLATMNAGTGQFESVQRVGTSGDVGADILAFDPNDNLFMAGWLNGVDQEFLTGDVLSSTLYDMVLVKLFADDPTNTAPTADAGGPYADAEDTPITFDASSSDDDDGDTLSYSWDFGDGTTAVTTSPTIDHTYEWGDTFTVSVTVSDGRGGTASAGTSATVAEVNDVPIADAGGTYSGVENEIVTFDASASTDFDNQDGTAANDQTLTYTWNFGDGSPPVSTPSPTVDYAYATAGTYDVSLKVNDGLVDSPVAMTTATVSPVGQPDVYDSTDVPKTIADPHKKRGERPATSLLTPSGTGTVVDTVAVDLTIDHAAEAGLTVTLTSAQDTVASLTYDGDGVWQINNSSAFQNENLDGTWKLTVTDTNRDRVAGTLQVWSMTVTPVAAITSSQSTASATDLALLAWFDLDSTDDEETDIFTDSIADDLALMLVG